MSRNESGKAGVDLDEVSRLVAALERDLEKVRSGAEDVETLRSEVAQLREALDSPAPAHGEVHEGLHGIRALLQKAEDGLFADYVARIGRMLGM
jgi:cell division septum initiation protein DivIVA